MMEEIKNRNAAIEALQVITSMDVAPVKFSFGYVGKDNICHEGLVITDCPPAVIEKLIKMGFVLVMKDSGLHVRKF